MTEEAKISDTLATLRKELESSAPTAKKKKTDLPRPALCDCSAFARRVHGLVLRGLVPGNATDPELSALVHAFQAELEELPEGCSVEHSDLFAQKMHFHDQAYAQLADAIVHSWSTVAAAMQQREERRVQHDAKTDTEAEEWRAWCRAMFPRHRQPSTVPAAPPPPASFAESEYMQSERAVREQQALLAAKVTDITEALQQPPPGPSPDTVAALKQEEQALRSALNQAVQYKAVVRERLLTAAAPLAVFQDPPEAAEVEDEEAQVAEAIGRVIEEESVKRKLTEYFDTREYLSYLIESHVAAMGAFLTTLFTHLRRVCDDIDQETPDDECAGCLYRKEVARRSALIAQLQTGGHAMFG